VVDAVATWRHLDGCGATATTTTKGAARSTVWARCAAGVKVQYVLFAKGGHRWPDRGATGPSAQQLIWAFFRGARPTTAKPDTRAGGATSDPASCSVP
jgi:poly(3-hydroxybutyrate) depolymerase